MFIDPNVPLGPQLGPPPPDRRPAPANVGGWDTAQPPARRIERVNWSARYGASVRTILEVEWLTADTFRVLRERWDPAHDEVTP